MNVDTTRINILGVPPYIFMALIGAAVSVIAYIMLQYKRNIMIRGSLKFIAFAAVTGLAGAKMFGIFVNIINSLINGMEISIYTFLYAPIVYYGGLLGFVLGFYLYCKKSQKEFQEYADILAVIIPMFHIFGRIGCFLAGCCYGMENRGIIAVEYTNHVNGEIITADRIPIQLIEAAANVIMCCIFLINCMKRDTNNHLLDKYFVTYSIIRFVLEFFRGDRVRGIYGCLSFSQYVSILIVIAIIVKNYRKRGMKWITKKMDS